MHPDTGRTLTGCVLWRCCPSSSAMPGFAGFIRRLCGGGHLLRDLGVPDHRDSCCARSRPGSCPSCASTSAGRGSILPALFVLVAACLAGGWFILAPTAYDNMAKSIVAALFFVSNIWFWKDTGDYCGMDAHLLPMLHTWSLAVEEQFYLGFPRLLVGAGGARAAGDHGGGAGAGRSCPSAPRYWGDHGRADRELLPCADRGSGNWVWAPCWPWGPFPEPATGPWSKGLRPPVSR